MTWFTKHLTAERPHPAARTRTRSTPSAGLIGEDDEELLGLFDARPEARVALARGLPHLLQHRLQDDAVRDGLPHGPQRNQDSLHIKHYMVIRTLCI